MKNLFQLIMVLFLFVRTIGFSQTANTETTSKEQNTILKKQDTKNDTDKFIGRYFLAEADFNLEIVVEDNKMYIISPFSKDLLIFKNKTTLHESIRGVDLELIKDDNNALKFTQNGYVTTIKRVTTVTQN